MSSPHTGPEDGPPAEGDQPGTLHPAGAAERDGHAAEGVDADPFNTGHTVPGDGQPAEAF